jgi:hypothetical protein
MSTKDQLLSVALHGTAMRYAAEKANLAEAMTALREMAAGRDDILAETGGIAARVLVRLAIHPRRLRTCSRRMLIMAGGGSGKPLDFEALERWTRVGYERGMRSRKGER